MKKLCKYCLLFIVLVLGFTVKANAAVKFYEGEYVGTIYINKVKNGVTHYMRAQFLQKGDDDTIAYCLDPFERFNPSDSYTSGTTYSKITQQNLNKIKLAAYYGYGYSNHTAKKWYAITQLVIWKYADPSGKYYFTDSLNGNKITTYDEEIQELETLINSHYKEPSFSKKTYTIHSGETIVLKDTNGVLKQYNSTVTGGIDVSKTSNQLTIRGEKTGDYKISLKKSAQRFGKNPVFYLTGGAQNLMTAGNIDTINTYLNIKVVGGNLKIIKHDEDNNSCKPSGNASLKGAVYNLYKDEQLIKTITIDENCEANVENLELGSYILKEVSPGEGYTLDKKEYAFTIDKDHLNKTLTLTNKVIKRKIILTKLYGNKTLSNYKVEPNIKFGVYNDKNEQVLTITTGKDGQATFDLAYGSYTIKQLTSTKNYEFSEDVHVTINENSDEEINIVLKNNIMTSKIKVYKIDADTKEKITYNHASFMIKDIESGKYIFQTIGNTTTNVFKTNDEGYFLSAIDLPFGKYELIEVKSPFGYILGNPFYFEINEDSHFNYDAEGNRMFEVYLENKKEIVKETIIEVPDTQSALTTYCWYPLLFHTYLYEDKKYC